MQHKREGDHGTLIASMRLLHGFYRTDRIESPITALPLVALNESDGWCDDPTNDLYNQHVSLPFDGNHEKMWMADSIYDICIVLDWNIEPAIPGMGSAIFFHLARENYTATEGCIALNLADMRAVLGTCSPQSFITTKLEN